MPTKIAIAGAAGRMGQALIGAAGADFAVVGGSEREGSPALGQKIGAGVIVDSVAQAAKSADVWIDFTMPAATVAALSALPASVHAAVVGTTGFDAEGIAAIQAAAKRIAIVKSGNFSLGVNLMAALVRQTAQRLKEDWDIEIVEQHHHHKLDAPSGTSLLLGQAAAEGRGASLEALRLKPHDGITGPRKRGGIGFANVRAGGIVGVHDVIFASDQEVIRFSHQALDRTLFAAGALAAAKWAADKKPGLYSMRDVLEL